MATTVGAARQLFPLLTGPCLRLRHHHLLLNTRNGQNAISTSSSTKRKAPSSFDSENTDPIRLPPSKRFKSPNGYPVTSPRRLTLHTCSPAPRLNTTTTPKSISLTVLAGRSPPRKRFGILNRGKTAPFCTHAGPRQNEAYNNCLEFSIDAALSSRTSRYDKCDALSQEQKLPVSKDTCMFNIYEDTFEELESNLMEHSICTLFISSDEESAAKMKDKKRGKENIPPLDDISQIYANLTGQIIMPDVRDKVIVLLVTLIVRHSARWQREDIMSEDSMDFIKLTEVKNEGKSINAEGRLPVDS